MNISDEALEAALNAFAPPRADRTPHIRQQYEKKIRAALEAAAPHLMAAAWDEGIEAGVDGSVPECDYARNPYRKPTDAP